MFKKILIALAILVAIGAVAAAIAGYQLNTRYGWLAASPVFHETLATGDTRLRVAADTIRLGNDLAPYLPPDANLPAWLPWDLPALLPRVLPREVAILGGSDFREGEYEITVFINEQRGGPALPTLINTRTRFTRSVPGITWEEPGFVLDGRGKLSAKGHLPLPPDLESTIRDTWTAEPPAEPLILNGGHLAEAVLDNRNGEIVALIGALAPLWNTSYEQLRANPQVEAVLALVADIDDLRVAIDFETTDSLLIQIRIQAGENAGKQLEFMVPFALPSITQRLKSTYDLKMTSENAWAPDEGVYKLDVTISGIEAQLKAYFERTIPRRAVPQPVESVERPAT